MFQTMLLVFLGGGAGSVARWAMMNGITRALGPTAMPWHTLGVNMLGAFIIGLIVEMLALRTTLVEPMRFLLITGFLGGFTTFSAFSLESALLLQKGDYATCAAYVAASVIGTIIAVFAGSGLVKAIS